MEGDGKAESDIRRKTVEKERQGQVKTARGELIEQGPGSSKNRANERLQPARDRSREGNASSWRSFLRNPGPAAEVWPGQCSRCP